MPTIARLRNSCASVLLQAGAFVLASFVASSCLAEPLAGSGRASTVRVTGRAVVSAAPDRAVVSLAVVSEGAVAADTVSDNARRVEGVLKAMRDELGDDSEISTSGYSLQPRYRYRKEGGQQLEGYRVSSRLKVVLDDVGRTGRVIDIGTGAGATVVQQIRFELEDDTPQRAEALKQATIVARSKADVVADALGMRVVKVLSVEEGGVSIRPPMQEGARMARVQADVSTPIEAGDVEVSAQVSMEVEVAK